MIQEEYVSFETAKLLKEKGFDEPCDHFYRWDRPETIYTGTSYRNSEIGDKQSKVYNTCTQQIAMRWLREVHNIVIGVNVGNENNKGNTDYSNPDRWWYFWEFTDTRGVYKEELQPDALSNEYKTYEEASEAAIKYCLEHLI